MRKLLNGESVDALEHPVDLIIHTKAPGKWKIIDMETGEEYIGQNLSNDKFAEILRNKVFHGHIGSWKKIKHKVIYVQQTLL
jgi:ABC-type transporter MlaC component